MALGSDVEDDQDTNAHPNLSQQEKKIDRLLEQLYRGDRTGGTSPSRPVSSKWFGQVRDLFPPQIVHLLQKDAIAKFGIKKLLTQASILDDIEPDVGLIASVLTVKEALSGPSLEQAKNLIRKLARSVEERLRWQMINRISGKRQPGMRILNPRQSDIDWHLTIRHNLKHYQPDLKTIIPHRLLGRPRQNKSLKNLILLVDQSASMTQSMIYAGILAGIMTSVKSLNTRFIAFDTSVVDLTDQLHDAVELLFKVQLGGGTDIQQAMGYAHSQVDPSVETHLVLISDLYEGAPVELLFTQTEMLLNESVHIIVLLALDDQGKPAYDRDVAARFAQMGIPSFACSPDQFPKLMAAALNKEDLSRFS